MESFRKPLVEYFTQRASEYESLYQALAGVDFHQLLRCIRWYPMLRTFLHTLTYIQNLRPRRVLDIGCGSGAYSVHLALNGARVTAIDICMQMLRVAERDLQKKGLEASVELVQADFIQWSMKQTGSYDLALAIGVFDYINDPSRFLASVRKLTEQAIITFPARNLLNSIAHTNYIRKGFRGFSYTDKQISGLITESGFRSINFLKLFPGTYWLHVEKAEKLISCEPAIMSSEVIR